MKIPWSKVAHLAQTLAPLLLADTKFAPIAQHVAHGITVAQQAAEEAKASGKPMTNEKKLQLAVSEVHEGIEATNHVAGRELLSEPHFDKAVTSAINATIEAINTKTELEGIIVPKSTKDAKDAKDAKGGSTADGKEKE